MRTLIASDIHDGNRVAHTARLIRLLEGDNPDRLILNGDVFDTDGSISADGWRLLDLIADIADTRPVILIPGNHDPNLGRVSLAMRSTYLDHVIAKDGYTFQDGGRTIHVRHGHIGPDGTPWDPYLRGYLHPTAIGNQFESDLSFWGGPPGRWLATRLHRLRKWVCDTKTVLREHALQLAGRENYDWVVCGHSHQPEIITPDFGFPGYVNCGSWCETKDTYVVVEDGWLRLEEFK